jgi:uncharacterized protein (TIGR03084 family)
MEGTLMPADAWALLDGLLTDLAAETADLDQVLSGLPPAAWERPTPATGWAVRDQVSHLAYFDEAAALAVTDPDRFRAEAAALVALSERFPDYVATRYRDLPAPELLSWFHGARDGLIAVFAAADPAARLPWYGPSMGPASSVTARLMETWAHGQDVVDAVGAARTPTARLRHVAHLGVRTFGHSFTLRGRPVPAAPVRVELGAPDGGTWTWGPAGAADTVRGPAVDFCLVVTQRRNLADTALRADGPVAAEWLSIAQAFAGAPGPGRPPANGTDGAAR